MSPNTDWNTCAQKNSPGLWPGHVALRPGIASCCGAKCVSPITSITRNRELRLHDISARERSVGGSRGIQLPAKRADCWNFDGLSRLTTSCATVQLQIWAMRYSGSTRFKPNQETDSSHWGFAVIAAECSKSNPVQVGSRSNISDLCSGGAYLEFSRAHWLSWVHFRDFTQSIPTNASILVKLGQGIFLPHIFHSLFTIIKNLTPYNLRY
jgi:hypothetical protein